jgi:hypothetical protein
MEFAKAFESFVAEPIRHRRIDMALYRMSQLLHDRTNGKFDTAFMKIAPHIRPVLALPSHSDMNSPELESVVTTLRQDGYKILPFLLSTRDIEEIKSFAFSTPAYGNTLQDQVRVIPDNIVGGIPRFTWRMHDLAQLPAVQRIVLSGPYCAIAQKYLGCRPVLVHISLWLDAPCEGRFEPYLYHYDNEGPGFLKFFFFLSDVGEGTGAHHFVAGSHFPAKPASVARSGLYSDEQIFAAYGRNRELIASGPPGTILAEDTKGFHRGSKITREFRLLMQLEFSVINVPTEQELSEPFPPVAVPGLHPNLAAITRKFYSRA